MSCLPGYTLAYWINAPVFDTVTLHPTSQQEFKIHVNRPDAEWYLYSKAILNGKVLNRSWLSYDEIMQGGDLTLGVRKAS
ncbi:MAG: glycoside hydrolase domain-containing protein [Bacteroides cellulosilyticus]